MAIDKDHVRELVLQALETERGGIEVYENAIECAENDELREEWEKYLEQTRNHERVMLGLCEALGVDPEEETPGRAVVPMLSRLGQPMSVLELSPVVWQVLATAGFAGGFVYWLLAGRNA